VVFGGHAGELAYPVEKVRTVSAIGPDARRLGVKRSESHGALLVEVDGNPVMLLMHFDNGIYTRTADGRIINRPMSKVENAVSAVRATKYHKTIRAWTELVTTAQGQPFEVVPVSKVPPRAGVPMEVRVSIDGEPAAGINVGTDETAIQSTTGPDGIATFTPVAGSNRLWAGQRTGSPDNPDFTQLSIEYLLTFDAH
jgi:nickel transport protein